MRIVKPNIKRHIQLRARIPESQADKLQQRLSELPFKIQYQQEQHGPSLVVIIGCTVSQEKILRDILHEVGASLDDRMEA